MKRRAARDLRRPSAGGPAQNVRPFSRGRALAQANQLRSAVPGSPQHHEAAVKFMAVVPAVHPRGQALWPIAEGVQGADPRRLQFRVRGQICWVLPSHECKSHTAQLQHHEQSIGPADPSFVLGSSSG